MRIVLNSRCTCNITYFLDGLGSILVLKKGLDNIFDQYLMVLDFLLFALSLFSTTPILTTKLEKSTYTSINHIMPPLPDTLIIRSILLL